MAKAKYKFNRRGRGERRGWHNIKEIDGKMVQAFPARYHAAEILDGDYNSSAERAESAEIGMGKGMWLK